MLFIMADAFVSFRETIYSVSIFQALINIYSYVKNSHNKRTIG